VYAEIPVRVEYRPHAARLAAHRAAHGLRRVGSPTPNGAGAPDRQRYRVLRMVR
jgi:hypothetical protein